MNNIAANSGKLKRGRTDSPIIWPFSKHLFFCATRKYVSIHPRLERDEPKKGYFNNIVEVPVWLKQRK